jgi:hypothetical protein
VYIRVLPTILVPTILPTILPTVLGLPCRRWCSHSQYLGSRGSTHSCYHLSTVTQPTTNTNYHLPISEGLGAASSTSNIHLYDILASIQTSNIHLYDISASIQTIYRDYYLPISEALGAASAKLALRAQHLRRVKPDPRTHTSATSSEADLLTHTPRTINSSSSPTKTYPSNHKLFLTEHWIRQKYPKPYY